jgi:oligopeptide/dipeptide ABC transporter ATP-binding protein
VSATPLLRIEKLRVSFGKDDSVVAVSDVSLEIGAGETLGLVGESGSGKSLSCRSVIRMTPPGGRMSASEINFDGRDVLSFNKRELRDHRAHHVGMIFQDPFSCLDPTKRVGEQISETLRVNAGLTSPRAREQAMKLLDDVDIDQPERRYLAFPHEMSGGMRQRVMIAIAVASKPKLLVADEPTTALDVTTQAQILGLLQRLREETAMSVLLVSHDFGVIAQVCDRVAVMYGGYVVEVGSVADVCARPQHPYTRALLSSIPSLESAGNRVRRVGIPGQPPSLGEIIKGCPFVRRCSFAQESCTSMDVTLESVGTGHQSACPVMANRFVAVGPSRLSAPLPSTEEASEELP